MASQFSLVETSKAPMADRNLRLLSDVLSMGNPSSDHVSVLWSRTGGCSGQAYHLSTPPARTRLNTPQHAPRRTPSSRHALKQELQAQADILTVPRAFAVSGHPRQGDELEKAHVSIVASAVKEKEKTKTTFGDLPRDTFATLADPDGVHRPRGVLVS
ncbi:hypothetical protein P4O66_010640 [Electrophorus voltai]|uniref:Uncharacterized protein n=1 Tax=Electrophorus voltai TaxID=2609070 RepID=A0AAD8ZCJ9_9TELE|nr:hypothetical protein P4O66_010640 [Electrophorus voltai]